MRFQDHPWVKIFNENSFVVPTFSSISRFHDAYSTNSSGALRTSKSLRPIFIFIAVTCFFVVRKSFGVVFVVINTVKGFTRFVFYILINGFKPNCTVKPILVWCNVFGHDGIEKILSRIFKYFMGVFAIGIF